MVKEETDFFDWFDGLESELGKFNDSKSEKEKGIRGRTSSIVLIDEATFMSMPKDYKN